MKRSKHALAGLAALAALAVPAASHAQFGEGGGDLVLDSATLDVFNDQGMIVLEGQVDAAQNDTQIRTDRLELYFSGGSGGGGGGVSVSSGMGDLTRAVAIGNVYYVTPEQIATGDRAVYDIASDTVTLTGNVVVKQGCDVVTGDEIVTNMTTNDIQVRSSRTGRVRTVIVSDDQSAAQGNCD